MSGCFPFQALESTPRGADSRAMLQPPEAPIVPRFALAAQGPRPQLSLEEFATVVAGSPSEGVCSAASMTLLERLRLWSTRGTWAGLSMLALALGLTLWALAHGVHCPECDRYRLSDEAFAFWQQYFVVKDAVWAGAAGLSVLSVWASQRRLLSVVSVLVSVFGFLAMPR